MSLSASSACSARRRWQGREAPSAAKVLRRFQHGLTDRRREQASPQARASGSNASEPRPRPWRGDAAAGRCMQGRICFRCEVNAISATGRAASSSRPTAFAAATTSAASVGSPRDLRLGSAARTSRASEASIRRAGSSRSATSTGERVDPILRRGRLLARSRHRRACRAHRRVDRMARTVIWSAGERAGRHEPISDGGAEGLDGRRAGARARSALAMLLPPMRERDGHDRRQAPRARRRRRRRRRDQHPRGAARPQAGRARRRRGRRRARRARGRRRRSRLWRSGVRRSIVWSIRRSRQSVRLLVATTRTAAGARGHLLAGVDDVRGGR